jgi:hypothetical protein
VTGTRLTDETLMLYADGVLDGSEREQVEKALAQSPKLRGRLQVFRKTGRDLAGVFDEDMTTPIPGGLRDLLSAPMPGPDASTPRPGGSSVPHRPPHTTRQNRRMAWGLPALAASIAVIVGIGFGWLLHGGSAGGGAFLDGLIQPQDGQLIAQGALQSLLETSPSGAKTQAFLAGSQQQFGVKMTFRDASGAYCREYGIRPAQSQYHAGVACRTGNRWSVKMQALMPGSASAAEQTIPAGADTEMDAVVDAMIDGDPLASGEEAALIGKGWK